MDPPKKSSDRPVRPNEGGEGPGPSRVSPSQRVGSKGSLSLLHGVLRPHHLSLRAVEEGERVKIKETKKKAVRRHRRTTAEPNDNRMRADGQMARQPDFAVEQLSLASSIFPTDT